MKTSIGICLKVEVPKKIVIHYISQKPLPQLTACGLPWGLPWSDDTKKIKCENCKRTFEFQSGGEVLKNRKKK